MANDKQAIVAICYGGINLLCTNCEAKSGELYKRLEKNEVEQDKLICRTCLSLSELLWKWREYHPVTFYPMLAKIAQWSREFDEVTA